MAWLTVSDVARMTGCDRSTILGWVKGGLRPRSGGERVILAARFVGGRWKTTRKRLRAFLRALEGPTVSPAPTPSLQRQGLLDQEEFRQRLAADRKPRTRRAQ